MPFCERCSTQKTHDRCRQLVLKGRAVETRRVLGRREAGLLHLGRDRWVFSYAPGTDDDEPAFKFDKHSFKPGEYVSITEHDGVTRPFKIVSVK